MKYWQSIDELPIYYYYKLVETGELEYLLKEPLEGKYNQDHVKSQLFLAWEKIELEFYDMMVLDADYVNELKKQLRERTKRLNALLKPDAFYKTLWEIEKVKKEQKSNSRSDYYDTIAALNKYLKFAVDDKKLSVRMYFKHLQMMKNGK